MSDTVELSNENEECLPIKVLEELKFWKSIDSGNYNICPLQKRASIVDSPKTLLCHDMKGGYLEDRFLNGTSSEDNYYFIHWSMVDIFVYFSHHLVTIPPPGWINAAHRNGVKVLGTFITEWDAGAKVCDSILCDNASVSHICNQLVRIAKYYKFDGWLINIENKLNQNQVPFLEEFVKSLTLKMHNSQQDSLVIWYDSVIETGELKWQNELNEHNRNFFLACDGIFLNYNWTTNTLKATVKEAGSRRTDVFVGVDVFGRGCLGGGGFSTDIAVSAAREFNLSVAIFAPGWVYECNDIKDFKENQYKFWHSLVDLCAPRVTESLPYYTSFCPGFGQKLFRNGKIEHSKPWFNLSLQQPQPSYHFTNCPKNGSTMTLCTEDAFNGGGCLKMTSKFGKALEFQILSTNICLNSRCLISYTFKALNKNVKVTPVFSMYQKKRFYLLNFLDKPDIIDGNRSENRKTHKIIQSAEIENKFLTSEKVIKHFEDEPWIKRKYRLSCTENEELFIKGVNLQISCEEMPETEITVLLGELLISPIHDAISFSYKDLNLTPTDGSCLNVECLLIWNHDVSLDFSDLYTIINGDKHYIGTTSQLYYKFKGCIPVASEIEFMLNPVHLGKNIHPILLKVPLNINDFTYSW